MQRVLDETPGDPREPAEHRALRRIEVCGGPPSALERICHDFGGAGRIDQDLVSQRVYGASVPLAQPLHCA
ncbi:MAG TPA: hypothetical protein VIW28_08710 [Gemmatimonadales bacterium]